MYAYCVREFSKKTAVSHDRAGSGMSKSLIMSINKSKNASGLRVQVKCKANAESNLFCYAEPKPSLAVAT